MLLKLKHLDHFNSFKKVNFSKIATFLFVYISPVSCSTLSVLPDGYQCLHLWVVFSTIPRLVEGFKGEVVTGYRYYQGFKGEVVTGYIQVLSRVHGGGCDWIQVLSRIQG